MPCLLECTVGIKDFIQSPEEETIEERLQKDGIRQDIKQNMAKNYFEGSCQDQSQRQNSNLPQEFFLLGQDVATDSILEASDHLLHRDYPHVHSFDGQYDGTVGTIVVPEKYIPRHPRVVDPEVADVVIQNNPDDRKLRVSVIIKI